jgi:hypothetical protein
VALPNWQLRVPVAAQLQRASVDALERASVVHPPVPEGPGRGPEGAGAPSLVPSSESVYENEGQICPRKPYWVTPLERPDLRFPASCDTYLCAICGPRKATQAAAVMTWALRHVEAPSRARFVTLTLADHDWPTLRLKVRQARRIMLKEGYDWEWGWAREAGKQTGMLHLHGVQHGRHKVPQARLQALWGARVDIRAVRGLQDKSGAAAYTVKEALRVAGYVGKGTSNLPEHLALNGGRPAHWTRGFLHGRTKREALTELRSELADGEPLTWRLVPAW